MSWATLGQLAPAPGLFPSGNLLCFPLGCPRDDRAQRAKPGRATEEPAKLSFPAGPGSQATPGRTGPKSARRTHLSLKLGAGGTGVQTTRAASTTRAPRASSLRARCQQISIGCALRKPTNTFAPWHLSSPPWASGAGPPCTAKEARVLTPNHNSLSCQVTTVKLRASGAIWGSVSVVFPGVKAFDTKQATESRTAMGLKTPGFEGGLRLAGSHRQRDSVPGALWL